MRVTSKNSEQTFKPIDFIITIENEKELENLRYISFTNVSIPDVVCQNYREANKKIVTDILNTLKDEIQKHDYTKPNN